ncbi:MAG: pitrilysin family protein [Pirellulaceae bacterium]
MQFRRQVLDNGLEIVAECNDRAHSMGLAFFVRTGSRDESPAVAGVSHFLEHMVFKGTPTRSADDVNRELDEIGSQSNAYTSEEQTVYYATVLPEYQAQAVDLLSDILRPSLRTDDFETEKQVIIEEIFKYDDQPPFGAYEKCMAAYFGQHPLGNNVLGTVESVGALTPDAMRSYFQHRYSPGNIVLAASGKVDFDALVSSADQRCGMWEPFSAPRDLSFSEGQTGYLSIAKEHVSQQYVVQISPGPAADDPDRYAYRLLTMILGDDSGSRLFWLLVDPGLAEYAVVSCYEFQGTGITMTYLSCMPEQGADNLALLAQAQAELIQDGIAFDELELAKSKICSHVVRRGERPSNRLFSVGNNWLQRGEYHTVRDSVERYRNITVDDILRVAERFRVDQTMTVTVGPNEIQRN